MFSGKKEGDLLEDITEAIKNIKNSQNGVQGIFWVEAKKEALNVLEEARNYIFSENKDSNKDSFETYLSKHQKYRGIFGESKVEKIINRVLKLRPHELENMRKNRTEEGYIRLTKNN